MRAPPKELIRFLKRFDPAIRELALDARELVLRVLAPSNESVLDVYVLAMNYGFSERMKDQVVYIGVCTRSTSILDSIGVLRSTILKACSKAAASNSAISRSSRRRI
jgi:hypothetical protein